MTDREPQTTRLVYGAHSTYTLTPTAPPAVLTLSSWRSRAQAVVVGEPYQLTLSGLVHRSAGAWRTGADEPVVLLGRRTCVLPTGSGQWSVRGRWRGYEGTLRALDGRTMALRLGHGRRADVDMETDGDWPALVVLTAAFALLMRRRDDTSAAAGGVSTVAAVSG